MPKSLSLAVLLLATIHQAMLPKCNGQVADGYIQRWVTKQAASMNRRLVPGPFRSMGWSTSLRESLDLAQKHERLVFLFTLDGDLDSGRC